MPASNTWMTAECRCSQPLHSTVDRGAANRRCCSASASSTPQWPESSIAPSFVTLTVIGATPPGRDTSRTLPSPSSVDPAMPGRPESRPSRGLSMTSMRSPMLSTCKAPRSPSTFAMTIGPASSLRVSRLPPRAPEPNARAGSCGRATRSRARRRPGRCCSSATRIVSTTASSGMPNVCPAASTVMT